MLEHNNKSLGGRVFLTALIVSALAFLPFVIYDGGVFVFYGDFNVQQIPFYKLAHEAVRSGDVLWNWYTDLGANFIGSYSFYLLFSPFFWLTLPFPTELVPFLMAPLLALKTACAALTAYMFLRRFVKEREFAAAGALLYAFSGWMTFNIFFNHFHEPAVFFPLLLLGVEKLVTEDKKCFFALMVALNAAVNYWFFAGEAVFVVLYVFVRMTDKSFGMNVMRFARLTFEAVLGVGLAAVVLLPSVLAITGNPRVGTSELSMGWNAWVYWNDQRLPAILQSIIYPPELPARPNFFPDHDAKWASMSAWLPMVGASGVMCYFFQRKNDWLKKILAISLLLALVPGLNSLFVLLNHSYYARWFFMPVLLMALATARAAEDSARGVYHYRRALKWQFGLVLAFGVISGLTPVYNEDSVLVFGLAEDLPLMWAYVFIALACTAVTAAVMLNARHKENFKRLLTRSVAAVSCIFLIFFMAAGKAVFERDHFIAETALGGRDEIFLPQETFARADAYKAEDNLLMFWHLPNIQAFHSIVPASIMEFYPAVGVTRDVGSRPEADFPALRPLLSVRWLFIEEDEEDQDPMYGYSFYGQQAGFNVYENENFIPMGFSYDECVTPAQLEEVFEDNRSHLMLKALVLPEDAVVRNADVIRLALLEDIDSNYSDAALAADAAARRRFTADSFSFDARGFSASTSFDSPRLVFFSVPFDDGWSATVNGEPAIIERANLGFMAVRAPAGEAEIRFDYMTPGLLWGATISLGVLTLFFIYLLIILLLRKKAPEPEPEPELFASKAMTGDEYLGIYGDKESRAQKLQRTLNEAAARYMPDELEPEEKTLSFMADEYDDSDESEDNGEQ